MRRAQDSIDLSNPENVIKLVTSKIKKSLEETRTSERIDLGRVTKLRFSSLPFCGVKWFLGLPNHLTEHSDRLVDFGYKFFTSVGHTVHDVMQTTLFNSEHVTTLTDWKCTKCKHLHPLLEKPPCECSNCGATKLVREEHTVQWKGSLGHVDEILLLDKKSKSVYILDYKTTSLSNVNKPDPAGYLAQISSYAVALKDSGYKVVGYALVYIPRDNPFKFRVSPYVFDEAAEYKARKRLTGWKESFDSASKVKSLDSALRLLDTRPCEHGLKAAHAECPHASNCAGQGARPENMVFLINKTHKSLGTFLPVRK